MDRTYIAQTGETLDQIALVTLGDERFFELLVDANPDFRSVVFFDGGERLRIPELPEGVGLVPAPWERDT